MATDLTPFADPRIVNLFNERNDLAIDLYKLALKGHAPAGQPCDDELECPECTLLIIAAEELKQPDPFAGVSQ